MGSEFPGAPKLLKGGLAVYDSDQPGTTPRVIVFQYNPDSIKRTVTSRTPPAKDGANAGAAKEDVLRVLGPPTESISLSISLSAADQLAENNKTVREKGLHPALAALELLLYPQVAQAKDNQKLAQQGKVQLNPANVPLTLLVWGHERVVPVLLTSFAITEEHFDSELNPVQAKVDLSLKVLTTMELKANSLGHSAYMSYHQRKEQVAAKDQPRDDSRVRGLLPKL